ncbi:MAG: hypothetical protein A2Y75_10315 [Candidatus Solincola sediminis]|uniref:DUF4190 domain-containing protein n=1 Tax=Candidatus Solincola sediminis TaxID=1797199 RepID=A0A1F2WNZ4_9ACTN|nr:MAG: hypothetical protein A2Y75_10315 [Candidatus Solincola sediminis]
MKTCAKCGSQNPDDAVFCANCGYAFQQPPESPEAPTGPPPPPNAVVTPPLPFAQPTAGYPTGPPTVGGPYQYPYVPANNGKATAALVLGILGIFLCPFIFPILALVFGYSAKNEIAASRGAQTGESNATAGIILGWVGIAIDSIWLIIVIIFIIAAAAANGMILLF